MKLKIIISFLIVCTVYTYGQKEMNSHKFPIPEKTSQRLFYLQRNLNANTIVYDANFKSDGTLDSENPVNVYWIRFEDGGNTMPLRKLERKIAFGIKHEKLRSSEHDYSISIVSFNDRQIYLKQEAPFKVTAYIEINGSKRPIDHIYVQAAEGKPFSKIDHIDIFGIENIQNTNLSHERLYL